MAEPAAVGVDVGGTKTHIRVEATDRPCVDLVVPTRRWWRAGSSIAADGNADALIATLPELPPAGSALVVGAHGVDSDAVGRQFRANLQRIFPGTVRVLNDAALAGPAAGYPGAVITVISGTGSIVLSADADGNETRIGGHGYLLGDEGSAPALVAGLARALLRAADRGRPDPIALAQLADAAGVPESAEREEDLASALHHHHSATDWGRLAPAVFAAADAGSPLAAAAVEAHAEELVELVNLHLAAGAHPEAVVLAGGVVTSQPRLAEAITTGIHRTHPDLPVVLLDTPPVAGAIELARRELAASGTFGPAGASAEPTSTSAQALLERSQP
jgi:N-acetylglucosamine kinase-like BadF-type ATPase